MTRERAISDLAAWFYKSESDDWEKMKTKAARIIDVWVSDGSLKLYEPKSAENKFADILAGYFPGSEVDAIWKEMDETNLKIIEK